MKYVLLVFVLAIMLAAQACEFRSDCSAGKPLHGEVVFTSTASNVRILDLEQRDERVVYSEPDYGHVRSVAQMSMDTALISVVSSAKGREVRELDLRTGQTARLVAGMDATYVPETAEILFYTVPTSESDVWQPQLARMTRGADPHVLSEGPKPVEFPNGIKMSLLRPPVRVGKAKYAVVGGGMQLEIVDLNTDTVLSIPVDRCWPQVYLTHVRQLLCTDWSTFDVFTVDLESLERTPVPELRTTDFVYVPGEGLLVYSDTVSSSQGESSAIFYRTSSGESGRISSGFLRSGYWRSGQPDA